MLWNDDAFDTLLEFNITGEVAGSLNWYAEKSPEIEAELSALDYKMNKTISHKIYR